MTSKDLSIFNSLRPFSIGFDDMFDQFESMLGNIKNCFLSMPS
jgi:molecular chaperone IbpA